MKAKILTVGKTYNTGNYTSTRVEMSFELDEHELVDGEVMKAAVTSAQQQVDWAFEQMMEERKPWLTPKHEKWSKIYKALRDGEIKQEDVLKVYRLSREDGTMLFDM